MYFGKGSSTCSSGKGRLHVLCEDLEGGVQPGTCTWRTDTCTWRRLELVTMGLDQVHVLWVALESVWAGVGPGTCTLGGLRGGTGGSSTGSHRLRLYVLRYM